MRTPPDATNGRVPPSGTVTFLFSDIEGSTRLLQHLGPRYKDVLFEHQRLLRAAWAAHAGYEVDTEGDSFFVAFPSAPDAVNAAAVATQSLAAHPWPEGVVVRVRMGLHTGTPEVVGGNYIGIDVHRAARIAAAGHGGQILLSAPTVELVRDGLPEGASLRDLGAHRLKDLLRPEALFQLVLPNLPDTFRPLKTLDRLPNNLPVAPTPLLGRERELAEVRDLLLRQDVRLVSLLGPGGAGKTRLALQIAADLVQHFPDGVYFVALAPVSDGAAVIPTVVQTLGIREVAGEPLTDTLRAFVREKRLLLVLDNLEQIIEPTAALVVDLLAAAPSLRLLATSRSPLRVRGEQEYTVPPLGLPDPRQLPALDELAIFPSVQLFTQRAVAAKRDFALTSANARAVAQVCVLLDGLPLALELAAARVKVLPPPALVQRLAPVTSGRHAGNLSLLAGGARDLPARQQTLTDTIAWSYDLLSEDERALYRRLAVFVDGWTLEAAEAVVPVGGALALDMLEGLASLVDKSLIRQEESGESGDARFSMLQVIREFGLLRLEEAGEERATRAAHAQYFTSLVEGAGKYWFTAEEEEAAWLSRFDAEHENLLATLAWAHDEHQVGLGLQLAGLLGPFWLRRVYYTEGGTWLDTFLAMDAEVVGPEVLANPLVRTVALIGLGTVLDRQGDYLHAHQALEEALTFARASGDLYWAATALFCLGANAAWQRDDARSNAFTREALALARGHNERLVPHLLNNLGSSLYNKGDLDGAEAHYAESERLAREQGQASVVAVVHLSLGEVAMARGDAARAARLFRESLSFSWSRGNQFELAGCLDALGWAQGTLGADASAARLFGMAAAIYDELGAARPGDMNESYERTVAELRERMGDAAFEAAFTAGGTADRAVEIPKLLADDAQ